MEPSLVNLLALTNRLMSSCCSRPSSVVIGNSSRSDSNNMSAFVCFTLSTVFTTLRHNSTASRFSILNFISPSCWMEKSTTSLMSFMSRSEFCCMIHSNCFRLSSSRLLSVRMAENPVRAFSGVRISWLMFERKRFFSLTEFSTILRASFSLSSDCFSLVFNLRSNSSPATSSAMTIRPPARMLVSSMVRWRWLRNVCCATWLSARCLFTWAM